MLFYIFEIMKLKIANFDVCYFHIKWLHQIMQYEASFICERGIYFKARLSKFLSEADVSEILRWCVQLSEIYAHSLAFVQRIHLKDDQSQPGSFEIWRAY